MSSRSLNKVQLIGNLTRDPELRYTPQGTAVCTFGLATNRSWTTEGGEKKEETEFHRIVAWNKLAELCSQLLFKGRRVFVEGRLQTRSWTAQDGAQRQATEIVIEDMIILDSRRAPEEESVIPEEPSIETTEPPKGEEQVEQPIESQPTGSQVPTDDLSKKTKKKKQEEEKTEEENKVNPDDIPF
jgi:single-strand DNA-binding protein